MTGAMALFTADPRAEERAARARHRALSKAQTAAAAARDRKERASVADAIRDTRARFPACRCALHRGMRKRDVRDLGGGCTMPWHACPRLDAVRRRLDK